MYVCMYIFPALRVYIKCDKHLKGELEVSVARWAVDLSGLVLDNGRSIVCTIESTMTVTWYTTVYIKWVRGGGAVTTPDPRAGGASSIATGGSFSRLPPVPKGRRRKMTKNRWVKATASHSGEPLDLSSGDFAVRKR